MYKSLTWGLCVLTALTATALHAFVPFNDVPVGITGTVEFEQFDKDGPSYAYNDTSPTNNPGKYRPGDVDIARCSGTERGYAITNIVNGEWLQYTVLVPTNTFLASITNFNVEIRHNGSGSAILKGVNSTATNTIFTGTLTSGGWKTTHVGEVVLPPGVHTLRWEISSPSSLELNYFTIYPTMPTGSPHTNQIYNLSLSEDEEDASANTDALQTAINSLNPGGGTIEFPAGTFYFLQNDPQEYTGTSNDSANYRYDWDNYAVTVNSSNIKFKGHSSGNTVLVGANRATTIIGFTGGTNYYIDNINFVGSPEIGIDGNPESPGLLAKLFHTNGPPTELPIGDLLCFRTGNNTFIQNVTITNCAFENPATRAIILFNVRHCKIINSTFNHYAGVIPPTTNYLCHLSIMGGDEAGSTNNWNENIQIIGNEFDGNVPYSTATYGNGFHSADGLAWLVRGGHYIIKNNIIHQYGLEGVQCQSGPYTIVANEFSTETCGTSTAAVVTGNLSTTTGGLTTYNSLYSSYSVVDNSIINGSHGVIGGNNTNHIGNYDLFTSGNDIYLSNQLYHNWRNTTAINGGSIAFSTAFARIASISGNTVERCTVGVRGGTSYPRIEARRPNKYWDDTRIFCNDLTGCIWYSYFSQDPYESHKSITVYANKLGRANHNSYAHIRVDSAIPTDQLVRLTIHGNEYHNINTGDWIDASPVNPDTAGARYYTSHPAVDFPCFFDTGTTGIRLPPINSALSEAQYPSLFKPGFSLY